MSHHSDGQRTSWRAVSAERPYNSVATQTETRTFQGKAGSFTHPLKCSLLRPNSRWCPVDYTLGRLLRETWAAQSDSLGRSGGCGMSSRLAHSLKKEHTVTPYPLRLVISCELKMTIQTGFVGQGQRERRIFQKHVCEEKARHTLRRDPVGSWEDKAYQCTGSFLSCWSTCDSAHSAHSAPDTHQHLATTQGTHSVSNTGQSRPSE